VLLLRAGRSGSRERLVTKPSATIKERQQGLPNGHLKETENAMLTDKKGRSADALDLMGDPLLGDPLMGDPLMGIQGANGSSGVESWLETSSKYHSCEMVED